LDIAVDVEGAGVRRQQGIVVGAQGCCLPRIKAQHTLGLQPRQFGTKGGNLIGALLRLAA
jgi:hypothetical protein